MFLDDLEQLPLATELQNDPYTDANISLGKKCLNSTLFLTPVITCERPVQYCFKKCHYSN